MALNMALQNNMQWNYQKRPILKQKAMIDTYNQKVNFVDFSNLENIISAITI